MCRQLSAVFVASLGATPAAADRLSYHATASGEVAFTDNVFLEQRGRQDGDLFFQVRPGLLLSYGLPRLINDLTIEAGVMQYALHSEEATVTGRAGWRALLMTGPRSEVSLEASGGTGVLSAMTQRDVSEMPVVEVQPLGQVHVVDAQASEYGSYTATRELRLSQRLFARASKTDDDAMLPTLVTSAEAGASLGLERAMRNNALSVEVGASVMRLEREAPVGALLGSRLDRQINPRARGVWRHDFDRRVSGSLEGGLVYVYPYGDDPYNLTEPARTGGWYPVVGGGLYYTDEWGTAQMSLRRDVQPNLLLAQNTVGDSAQIAAALPLPWFEDNRRRQPRLIGMGSVSVVRTQLVDPFTADLQSSIGTARVDLGFMYAVRPGFTYGLRYELMLQTGDSNAAMPIPGYFRNTFYFSFRLRYPEDVAATVPKRRGSSVRADGGDLAPHGAEPVVPDLLEPSGGDR